MSLPQKPYQISSSCVFRFLPELSKSKFILNVVSLLIIYNIDMAVHEKRRMITFQG